jgi:hypothetical protein
MRSLIIASKCRSGRTAAPPYPNALGKLLFNHGRHEGPPEGDRFTSSPSSEPLSLESRNKMSGRVRKSLEYPLGSAAGRRYSLRLVLPQSPGQQGQRAGIAEGSSHSYLPARALPRPTLGSALLGGGGGLSRVGAKPRAPRDGDTCGRTPSFRPRDSRLCPGCRNRASADVSGGLSSGFS